MALIVTITDNKREIWSGPLNDFERVTADAIPSEYLAILFDHGEIEIGGGAAPLLTITLVETDAPVSA